ncbi:MAG TPA: DUF1345 domain-containing protein [Micrococcaceae bacterium]|nr:DUF1345 domain-containing protein [Micrococcaceae bacterium]
MNRRNESPRDFRARLQRSMTRLLAMFILGLIAAVITGIAGEWTYAPAVGWLTASLTYSVSVYLTIHGLDAEATSRHATREDPGRAIADALLLVASVASFAVVGLILIKAGSADGAGKVVLVALALTTVGSSWFMVHTLFALRYAHLYYTGDDGGVDFNQKAPPRYGDFSYLSFTLGMTFQVSDTNITSDEIRALALRHALLSYSFGAVIIATVINLVGGLSK